MESFYGVLKIPCTGLKKLLGYLGVIITGFGW